MTTATYSPSTLESVQSPRSWGNPPAMIRFLFIADVVVALMAVVAHGVSVVLGTGKFQMFRLGQENNFPTWFSSSQLLLVALVLGLFAHQRMQRLGKLDWRLLLPPAFFLLLSLDETASIHERVGTGVEALTAYLNADLGMRVGAWTLVCAPLFLFGLYLLARLTRPFWAEHPSVKWKFLIGFAVAFISAVGGELIMSVVPAGGVLEKAETFFEELGEMIGITILLWAAWDLLNLEGNPLTRGIVRRVRSVDPASR